MITVWVWVLIDRNTQTLLKPRFGEAAVYWSLLSTVVVLLVGLAFTYDVVRFSHRVVGPIYRLRKCFRAIVDGEDLTLMTLRKNDFLQELKDEFNQMLKVLEERGAVTLNDSPVSEKTKSPFRHDVDMLARHFPPVRQGRQMWTKHPYLTQLVEIRQINSQGLAIAKVS